MAAREQRGAFFFCPHLCLNVISSDDVSYGSQSGRGNLVVGVPVKKTKKMFKQAVLWTRPRRRVCLNLHEKLDEAPADAGVDDGLDLVVGAVREIGQGPAGVCQQVWVAAE